jgi:Uma2 family endonuclease
MTMTTILRKPLQRRGRGFDPDFRFTVAQYQKMVAEGIIEPGARVELLNGKVVNKMSRNPPDDTTLTLTEYELRPMCGTEWFIRVQMAVVTGKHGQPEPDIAVVRAPHKRYAKQHPTAKEVGLLVEVGDSTLLEERREKAPIYAGARIPWFWIVNVPAKIVEVYSDPKGGASPEYRDREDYGLGQKAPVVLGGKAVGQIDVRKLFPDD